MTKLSVNTVIPLSLMAVIVMCTIHVTVMFVKITNQVDRLMSNSVLVTDMEHWTTEFRRHNPNITTPDMLDIMQKRRNFNN